VHHFAAAPRNNHSSSPGLATRIQRPTRGFILPPGLRRAKGSANVCTLSLSEPGQLSPPIWSCTTRGLPCPRCCHRGGGLLPHLFTLTDDANHSKMSQRFCLRAITGLRFAGGIFSVALAVALPFPAAPPGVTRRVALHPESRRLEGFTLASNSLKVTPPLAQSGVRTFLPPSPLARTRPAIVQLTRQNHYTTARLREDVVFESQF
jgi:hypothetical protein